MWYMTKFSKNTPAEQGDVKRQSETSTLERVIGLEARVMICASWILKTLTPVWKAL